jgi:hypothetical protein
MFSVYFQFGFLFRGIVFRPHPAPAGFCRALSALWDNPSVRRGLNGIFCSLPLLGGALLKPDVGFAAA